ncbi:unnamed protein product [Rotaria sp. Silwood2]|nr:unnamed protein product [Rotaria sp. Silwood2]CAF2736120.1 unnamed protein product [Rotaria sp. Silwood2]CAF3150701.1 unnamed protein product [Rotaria sp. Silwood2]CAF3918127.1 unnamed protein product [Rotaria sp. Silwood2]CAF3931478.1 unnamed protein product [Rotaria sp. Silwood2]
MGRMLKMLWLALIATITAKDLPGLDYLISGFDALKMIGTNEDTSSSDRSKFRLFDLRQLDGEEYILKTANRTQSFKTPSLVQVTNINMRNRVSVESVSYTYREFLRSYFHSYSFEIAIPVGPANIALGYHKTLKEAYQTISKKQTAIGMSTDWWGMFSVQLAPTYILAFDPIFNRSLSKLIANPTTDTQQMYYNQLILTFGTHYISSIVVGGAVEMFTQVTSEYQETHSKVSVEQQVSVGFGYQQAQMSASTNLGFEVGVNTEDFKKNAQMEVKFSPAVITTSETEKKQWDIWLDRASSSPVVVNRTISPLINLLIEYPIEIRRHLELTIDYYLKNGKVPTIDDLSNVGQRKKRAIGNQNVLPGLDIVGCGYDIFSLKSKSCLLDMTMNDNTTWIDVFDNFTTYKVPDGYFVTGRKDLLSMYDTVFFNTLKEFVTDSYISDQHDSSDFLGFGVSADKVEMRTRYQRFYQHKYRMAWTKQQVIWFNLAVVTFPSPKLNRIASLAISRLPTTFDPKSADYKKFQLFFYSYGTHIVVRSDIGGMLWAEDYFESCLITKMTEKWIRREITKRYWFFGTSREITETYNKEVEKEYQQNSLSIFKIIGGLTSIFPLTGYNWLPTVKDNPSPVTYGLQPIYNLLPQGAQRDALKEATFYFRSAITNSTNLYIQRLESETDPPPLPQLKCTERRRRRKRDVKTNPFLSNIKNARLKLCPIIGYHGMFCPGDETTNFTNKTFSSTNGPQISPFQRSLSILPLPRAIGTAIHIGTGDILLPALDRSRIGVNIFPTENDLVKVWLRGYETGQWSGGELARTKDISDVYEKFLKNGQATAISQDFKVLYTLSMKSADNPKSLVPNEYAQAAINALTVNYDEELYNSFIDAWGPHITVSNKVGGMTEQQVIFKNCMINTTNFTDGTTQSILERNLRQ